MMRLGRRQFLLGTSGATIGALAGCLGAVNSNAASQGGQQTARASFFVVSDFATHVAGDSMAVRNLVPFGQHGHGWEPGPDIQRDVLGSAVFIYVGEGFQPWADKMVRNIREDGSDVAVVEAWEGIDLLDATPDHEESHDSSDGDGDHDESTDEHDEESAHEEEGGHDDHGAKDPHFWLDPSRATQSVETIASGLAEIDPENESTYVENASSFAERLTNLDSAYRERFEGRTKDAVLVAGHNSFQYLEDRYEFRVEALTGLAPDAEPTPRDIKRARSVIDEHDIEHVLTPVFESDRAARQLVEETDATDVLPLTPVPSLTEEWNEKGWGYVEVMENVNLPSLTTALGVE